MRLGQLTRQLEIEAIQVINFFALEGMVVENHPNTKLSPEQVDRLITRFSTKDIEQNKKEEILVKKTPTETNIEVSITQTPKEQKEPITESISQQIRTAKTQSLKETKQSLAQENEVKATAHEEQPEIITLPKEEVAKLLETGEIVSAIEAEAATLTEDQTIKAKFTTLEGLNVKGKIDLPRDPKREKKEAARKIQEEVLKERSDAGKTINGVHPNKRAKDEGEQTKANLIKSEEETFKRLERKKKRIEKEVAKKVKASQNKKSNEKKNNKTTAKVLTPEELKKKLTREKRQRTKEKANLPSPKRGLLQRIWDAIK